eukprot:2525942-Rhodomonas_salina.1
MSVPDIAEQARRQTAAYAMSVTGIAYAAHQQKLSALLPAVAAYATSVPDTSQRARSMILVGGYCHIAAYCMSAPDIA